MTDASGQVQARLAPGARLPLVFEHVHIVFGAGSTSYELSMRTAGGYLRPAVSRLARAVLARERRDDRSRPADHQPATAHRRARRTAPAAEFRRATARSPSSADAATRLGWTLTAFNRKLDNVCDKLDRIGVTGLRGGRDNLATNRRLRLVEYAIATRLVTRDDLAVLELLPPPG